MQIIDLLKKIENGEIKDATLFYGGDLFYKLIVIDKNIYILNTNKKEFQLANSKLIGNFIKNEYKLFEYKMVID